MRSQSFPTNCGINLLTDFGNTTAATDSTKYTVTDVSDFLRRVNDNFYTKAINMITLNDDQKEILHDTIISFGYELLNEKGYYHPSHGTELFIYVRRNYKRQENGIIKKL